MKSKGLLIGLFTLCVAGLHSQNSLNVLVKTGSQSTYSISSVKKLTFSSGNMQVNLNDLSVNTFLISNVRNMNFGIKTAIQEISNLDIHKFIIYPTPAINELHIQYTADSKEMFQLKIIDIQGRTVSQQALSAETGINYNTISVSHLKHGLYLCLLQNGTNTETTKFLKD
jgi:hypothetical protein